MIGGSSKALEKTIRRKARGTSNDCIGGRVEMKQYCQDTLDKAYLLLDGEGTPEEREEIRVHLEECSPCYERYGLDAEVKKLMSRLRGCTPCPDQLRTKISDMLQSQ